MVADLRKSLDAFLHEVTWSDQSSFRELLLADWTFTSDRLEKFYGETWRPADKNGPSLRRSVPDPHRVGVLNHPLLMSKLSYYENSSPIHRGVFLYRKVLGRVLRPPNAAFSPLNPDLHPKLTTRERVEMQTGEVNCQVCHAKINALGFSLENLDPVGRFRDQDNGSRVDASGSYMTRDGKEASFTGPRELATFLADSEDCHRAFVDSCFEYFAKQPIAAYGPETLERLTKSFQDSEFNMRELIIAIAVTVASQTRDAPTS